MIKQREFTPLELLKTAASGLVLTGQAPKMAWRK